MDYLFFGVINTTIPLAQTTVKTTLNQFSFPNDPILQNTRRKRYIQNEQELSTLFILWALSQSPIEADNFLLDPVSPNRKKILLDNTVYHLHNYTFPRRVRKKKKPVKALHYCGLLSEAGLITTKHFFSFKLVKRSHQKMK